MPKTEQILSELGANIRLARLCRNITVKFEVERAGISIITLAKIESGSPSVSRGNYIQVQMTLGLEKDILQVALDDELGRKIQDAGLSVRRRASKRGTK